MGAGAREVPELVVGEALRLRVDAEGLVPGNGHRLGRVPPGRRLFEVGAEGGGMPRMALHGLGRRAQVPLRHQVRVDVVVRDRAVLVRPGDAVDAEAALGVVVAERAPEPRRLHEELQTDLALEGLVARRLLVPHDSVGDVGADVERRRAGRPVARALLAADRAPRESGPVEAELDRPLACELRASSGASGARRRPPAAPCR